MTIYIDDVGSNNPSLILFRGTYNGSRIELIQHISQINVMLIAMPARDSEHPKRIKIGFEVEGEKDDR